MKKTGINLIRTHYPQSPEFLALCDRLGILFLEELPINWWGVEWFGKEGVVQDEPILDRALPMLETMIRRDRNHPCVIIWSMANESKTDNAIGIKVMRTLIGRTKELDPTRLVTFVTAPGSVREHRAYEDADLVATNMYYGSLGGPSRSIAISSTSVAREAVRGASATSDRRVSGQAAVDRGIWGDGHSRDARRRRLNRGFPGRLHPLGLGGDLRRARGLGRRPVVLGRLQPPEAFQAKGPFGAFGAVTIDRRPKAALKALAAMYGGELD